MLLLLSVRSGARVRYMHVRVWPSVAARLVPSITDYTQASAAASAPSVCRFPFRFPGSLGQIFAPPPPSSAIQAALVPRAGIAVPGAFGNRFAVPALAPVSKARSKNVDSENCCARDYADVRCFATGVGTNKSIRGRRRRRHRFEPSRKGSECQPRPRQKPRRSRPGITVIATATAEGPVCFGPGPFLCEAKTILL